MQAKHIGNTVSIIILTPPTKPREIRGRKGQKAAKRANHKHHQKIQPKAKQNQDEPTHNNTPPTREPGGPSTQTYRTRTAETRKGGGKRREKREGKKNKGHQDNHRGKKEGEDGRK